MTSLPLRTPIAASLATAILLLTGCSGYMLRGRVVEGDASWVTVTNQAALEAEDSRPVQGAVVDLVLDPGRLNRKQLGTARTDANGEFAIKVDEFGAGWMEHDVGMTVSRDGFVVADGFFRLPPDSQRILVTFQRGRNGARPVEDQPYDYRDDIERFGR